MNRRNKSALALSSVFALSLLAGCANGGKAQTQPFVPYEGKFDSVQEEALALSNDGGCYKTEFTLNVAKKDKSHKIYYTADGSEPTTNSVLYDESEGIKIEDMTQKSDYKLSTTPNSAYLANEYTFNKVGCGTALRFIEVDSNGKVVAEKTKTYIVDPRIESYSSLPVICLTADYSVFFGEKGFYNDLDNDRKVRLEMEYYDYSTSQSFSLNTQAKLGGNWTKSQFPNHTINLNYNKDENGDKNAKTHVNIFPDSSPEDGGKYGGSFESLTRFRLHNGGNDATAAFFSDAFSQRCVDTFEGLDVATTSYRPARVYLNGEYWGVYAMREHYSDVYFEANYGVDKDEVIYVDRTTTAPFSDYCFEVQEGDEAEVKAMISELTDFLMNTDFTIDENYNLLLEKIDVKSLADMVLVHEYVGNWDFMYNNMRMWRTKSVDESNPYADGRWRFCLHDLDFSFENEWADFGLWEGNDPDGNTWRGNYSYLDFFLGEAPMFYGGTYEIHENGDFIPKELCCILTAPMQNKAFRELFEEESKVVAEAFAPERANEILRQMKTELQPVYPSHVKRWERVNYSYDAWKWFVSARRDVVGRRGVQFEEDIANTLARQNEKYQ